MSALMRLAVGMFGLVLAAAGARAAPPIWTVYGSRGVITLFGSVHMLPPDQDWRSAALNTALANANTLWFELPINEATDAEAVRLTTRRARMPAADSLWAHLSSDQRVRVERAALAVGVSPPDLGCFQPWMAELTLSLADARRAGADGGRGVEAQLQKAAPPTIARRALETVGGQVAVLAGGSLADQLASLDETAREIVDDPDLYGRTVREWLASDLAGLQRDSVESLRRTSPCAYRRLILDRNRRWVRDLERLARTPGHALVVVGVGHLLGPDGVPSLLRGRGLRVEENDKADAKSGLGPD